MAARRLIRRAAVTGGPDAAELAWALGRFDEVERLDRYAFFCDAEALWREHRNLILRAWRKAGGVGAPPILSHLRGRRGVADRSIRWCARHGSDEARAALSHRLAEWAVAFPRDPIKPEGSK